MDPKGKDGAYDETVTPVTANAGAPRRSDVAQLPTMASDAPGLAATGIDATGETISPAPADMAAGASTTTGEPGPGAKLDHFTVLDRLGSGGMGVVLAAYDPDLDRKVAIKLLRPDLFGAGSDAARARLLREAQAMAKLTHPNVITVHEVGMVDGRVFVAMEYVDGGTLRRKDGDPPRPWREALDLYVQAGRGLAAAHRAGLVHRDFKPDNVLVGKDGRVRVTDFGLVGMIDDARGAAPDESRATVAAERDPPRLSQSNLTRTGSIMGTPAYMAPEQHVAHPVDARADQFAFCVSLHEAIYGVRPFAGARYEELVANVLAGKLVAPPPGIEVPGWLRAVIVRGLSVGRGERYPDMDAVLAELAYDRRHARRRTALVAAGFAVVLGVAGVAFLRGGDADRCQGARGQLAGAWDSTVARSVAAAFAAAGRPATAGLGPQVDRMVEGYATSWAAMWKDACEATHVRGEQTGKILDLRMRCLYRRREELGALTQLWTRTPDDATLSHAVDAAASLTPVSGCGDLDALSAVVPLPDDPAVRKRIDELEHELAAVAAQETSGNYLAALTAAKALVTATATIDYAPLKARVLVGLASLQDATGDDAAAAATYRDAATEAARAADDKLIASVWLNLASVHTTQAHYDLAEELLTLATAAVARAGNDLGYRAELANMRGTLRLKQGKYDEARTALDESITLALQHFGPDHPRVARTLGNTGVVYLALGDIERAGTLLRQALAIEEKVYTPGHPEVMATLNNLAKVHQAAGQPDQARPLMERALGIATELLGADHPDVATYHDNLGIVLAQLGELDAARPHHEHALAVMEKARGKDHPDVARVLQNLGSVEKQAGNYPRARELIERAIAINEKALGADHPILAIQLVLLANTLGYQGEHALAREKYLRAIAIQEKALGKDHPELAGAFNDFGTALEAQGQLADASAQYERALAIWEKTNNPQLSIVLTNLGSVANKQGRYRDATGYCERVRTLDTAALGTDHPDIAYSLTCLGIAARGAGRATDAVELLERALALRTGKTSPDAEAESRFELARALWPQPRDRARARELAETARGQYEAAGAGFTRQLGEVDAWLRAHVR